MDPIPIEIRPFDPHRATDDEFVALHACVSRLEQEQWPDDPPGTVDRTRREKQGVAAYQVRRSWVGVRADTGAVIAIASAGYADVAENRHAAGFDVGVLPEYRRRGIASRLLARVVAFAREADRRLLFTSTLDRVPASEAFLRRLGARAGLTLRVSQLDLAEVDPALMRAWQERARQRAAGFRTGWWDGPYPEEALPDVVAMKEAVNLMPRGDLEMEDQHATPETIRQEDAAMLARHTERWCLWVREPEAGRIAGYTEVFWSPDRPHVVWQGDTAVFTEFQNRGLGRLLKAMMVERLLRERPRAGWVRTWNSHDNAPMLKINVEMGFRPYVNSTEWQVERERVAAYLAARGGGAGE